MRTAAKFMLFRWNFCRAIRAASDSCPLPGNSACGSIFMLCVNKFILSYPGLRGNSHKGAIRKQQAANLPPGKNIAENEPTGLPFRFSYDNMKKTHVIHAKSKYIRKLQGM